MKIRAYGIETPETKTNGFVSSRPWERIFESRDEFKIFLAQPPGEILVNGWENIEEADE